MGNEYPKVMNNKTAHQPELTWRDFRMHNLHIQHDKMLYLKDVADIIDAHRLTNDFCNIPDTTYNWYLSQTPAGSGAGTIQCLGMVNGVLNIPTEGDDGDNAELTQRCECWQFEDCYPLYAELRFYIDDVLDTDFWFGFVTGHSWLTPPADYAVFHKDDGDAYLDFSNTVTGGAVTNSLQIMSLVKCTWYRLGIHWDGGNNLRYFVIEDGDFPQTILATGLHNTNIPTTVLNVGFGIQSGEDEVKNLYVDYIKCAQKRVI